MDGALATAPRYLTVLATSMAPLEGAGSTGLAQSSSCLRSKAAGRKLHSTVSRAALEGPNLSADWCLMDRATSLAPHISEEGVRGSASSRAAGSSLKLRHRERAPTRGYDSFQRAPIPRWYVPRCSGREEAGRRSTVRGGWVRGSVAPASRPTGRPLACSIPPATAPRRRS